MLVKILHEEFVVQVATPICYDQFANAEEIEKLGKKNPNIFAKLTKNMDQVLGNP